KINATCKTVNAAWSDSSSDANAVREFRTRKGLDFRDSVIVRLALAVAKPCEKAQGNDDDADTDSKFCLFLHASTPTPTLCYPSFGFYHSHQINKLAQVQVPACPNGGPGGCALGHIPTAAIPKASRK